LFYGLVIVTAEGSVPEKQVVRQTCSLWRGQGESLCAVQAQKTSHVTLHARCEPATGDKSVNVRSLLIAEADQETEKFKTSQRRMETGSGGKV